jgi:kumamolisin
MAQSPKRVNLPRSERRTPLNATDTGRTPSQQIIAVSLIVRRKTPLSLKDLKGRVLSREEFDQSYAARPEDFDQLRQFARDHALSVDEAASSLSRRTLVLRGTAEHLEKAFGVELHNYQRDQEKFHGFTGAISLPQGHTEVVEAVLGLDARPLAKPHIRFLSVAQRATSTSYTPLQVAALYNFPIGVNGSGQTIGLIELGGGYRASDVSAYFASLNLTPPEVVSISVDGGANAPTNPSGADGEVALDIEVAGAIAPGAKIAV